MDRALSSLSLISTLWHKYNKGYIDAFVPLFATLLIKKKYTTINSDGIEKLIQEFIEEYGIQITYFPFISIIKKCQKYRIIEKKAQAFYINKTEANKFDITSEIENNIRKYNEFRSSFIDFAKSQYSTAITPDEADEKIRAYLSAFDMDLVFVSAGGQQLPQKGKQFKNISSNIYIFAKYIIHISRNDATNFSLIVGIAIGNITANAVLIGGKDWQDDSLKNCEIYLDTPLLIKLIGGAGSFFVKNIEGLMELMKKKGGKLNIFEHTQAELYEIINACEDWIDSPNYDPNKANDMTVFLRQEGYSASEVHALKLKTPDILAQFNIITRPIPDFEHNKNRFIDEAWITNKIKEILPANSFRNNSYRYDLRIKRDVDSISAIYRLRDDSNPTSLRKAKYIFLTSNAALSYVNLLYGIEKRFDRDQILGCLTDLYLGTLLWINSPHVADMFNKQRLIAIAQAAIRPDSLFEARLYQTALKMITQGRLTKDDYVLVVASYLSKEIITEKTLNDPDAITEITVSDLVADLKNRLIGKTLDDLKNAEEEKRKIQEETIKLQKDKENEKNSFLAVIESMAQKKTNRIIVLIKITFWALIILPIFSIFFKAWYIVFLSPLSGGISAYFTFLKKFSIKAYERFLYEKFKSQLYLKYHIKDENM